jgi:hypothetical protein
MQSVVLHVDETTRLEVHRLRGELVPTNKAKPPTFDDKQSFIVRIDNAEIALSTESLANLLNRYTFRADAPLRNLTVSTDGELLKVKGTLAKGINVPFAIEAQPLVDTQGNLRLHTKSAKVFGFLPKGLMAFFGLHLNSVIGDRPAAGVRVEGDDFVMSPGAMVPPPRIEGRLQSVRVEPGRLVQTFGPGHAAALHPPDGIKNYMYYRGGVLRFGKLTMDDTDMALIDQNAEDPFDFYQEKYLQQLVAGYSKNTPSQGLKVFMPDYYRLSTSNREAPQRSTAHGRSRGLGMPKHTTH